MRHVRSLALTIPFAVVALAACVGDNPVATTDGGAEGGGCTRLCNGVCAPNNDPTTGCGAVDCQPCATLPNQTATCVAGACAAGACAGGHLDCDPNTPGCETVVDASNCGKCGTKCGTTNTSAVACGSAPASDAGAADAGGGGAVSCQFTCNGAYAHCSADDGTGCETNISTDQNNCGACGHSCLGGQCVVGKCQASIVASNPSGNFGFLYGLVLNGTSLYGINWYGKPNGTPSAGSVFSVPSNASNGTPTWLVKDGTAGAYGGIATRLLATNGNKLVYSVYRPSDQAAGLWTANFDGTGNSNVVGGGPDNQASCGATLAGTDVASLAFDPTYMYWTHDRAAGAPCPGLYRGDPNGANTALHQSGTFLRSLVSDGSGAIYMVSHTGSYPAFAGIAVLATTGAAIDNAPIVIAQTGNPYAVQFDAQYVYWNDTSNSHFYRTTKVPSTIEDVTPKSGMPTLGNSTFLVDAKNLYFFAGASTQSLYVMPKDGSAPPVVVFTFPNSGDIMLAAFQDDKAVYFSGYPTSVIYRLAK